MPVDLPAAVRPQPKPVGVRMGVFLVFQVLTLIGLGVVLIVMFRNERPSSITELPSRARNVASKLKAAGALGEAADLYERYLNTTDPNQPGRAAIAFSLGKLYLEQGMYEKALRWFYEAQSLNPGDLSEEVEKKVVHCLEALGRVHAAKAVLDRSTKLAQPDAKRPDSDPVVAKISKNSIHLSDLQRALDDLPPFVKKRFAGKAGLANFLQKYVADELIYKKAQKLEYDSDPEVRRQFESMLKQLVVSRFIEKEILGKLEVTEADLNNFFEANRSDYDDPPQLKIRRIKTASAELASELHGKLKKGASFQKLAKAHSLDNKTKKQGGLLDGWIKRGEDLLGEGDPKQIFDQLFDRKKGQTSDPIVVGSHHYIVRVVDKKAGKPTTLEQVRKKVEYEYRIFKSQAAYSDLVRETLSAEEVELFPEKLADQK